MKQLKESLAGLRTDHLDLWEIHEVIYETDTDLHFAKGGVIEALDEAKKQGKVRFVRFTGHKTRRFISRCWEYNNHRRISDAISFLVPGQSETQEAHATRIDRETGSVELLETMDYSDRT